MAYVIHIPRILAPRPLGLRGAFVAWRARARRRRALLDVPASLRKDVGLDGGLPLARYENGGRTFVVGNRCDPTLSGWYL